MASKLKKQSSLNLNYDPSVYPVVEYKTPATTSKDIGSWDAFSPVHQNLPWSQVKRYPIINSEMTDFVNKMHVTNREFSLF
ncbi:hypothetical protein BOX15_Mlig029030g2 [Macrostomum lignano]|uniref:Ovule protein n=2 Tax=Macrostomum lignano TaxID=282301 RepID=A0A1I8GVL8_9PLAT|nr:hypothetical protein BOX15_Mlig029030g1 [Macrostomum lignano]PAA85026.1 hypothetical protein BOX15_Mlig029030g2 [Macrostomum lignano]